MTRSVPRAKLAAAVSALATMAVAAIVSLAHPASAEPVLLSQGKPATASSTENAGTPASAAVDGNTGTRWSSAFSDPQWIQVDLGETAAISQVVLRWEAAYARSFQVQVSGNGTAWTDVYATTTAAGGVQTLNVTGNGRYVRVLGTVRATGFGYSLWEFQVIGTVGSGGGCGTANAALGRPASASSVENAGTPASAGNDGNVGTRWSSAFSDPQWWMVDLGSQQQICQIVITWEPAYARAFQIQVSGNATTWTNVFSTTTGTGGTQTINVTATGRYVRLFATQRATQYGYSLWEFVVRTGTGPTSGPTSAPPSSPPSSPTPSPTPSNQPGDVLLSYNKPAVASTFQNEGPCVNCTPAKAFDMHPATRWATSSINGWVDPGWIYVDLGATANVHRVVLQWDPAFATAYQIQVSANASTWTTIYSTTTGRGFKENLIVNGTGRYVRMFGTARSNGFGYSLWEFQVYGTGGAPVAPPALPPDPAVPGRLVFSDEFNTAAGTKPDAAKWRPEIGAGQNNELQYYTNNNNANMDGAGSLVLEARREVTAGSSCPGGPCQYTSGRLNTAATYTFTYGHVEARIKVSGTQGLWPAFWLLGADFPSIGWPSCGEIDIMEHVGKEPQNTYGTLHAPAYFGGNGAGGPYTIAGDFMNDFHVFAIDWNSSRIAFSVDGNVFLTQTKAAIEAARGPWVYDHPFFIILNNAVGGDWPGAPNGTTVLPQRMMIDYVRVYQ